MPDNAKEAFESASLGAENKAYEILARLDPEYFEKLKGIYVDATFGRDGALPRKSQRSARGDGGCGDPWRNARLVVGRGDVAGDSKNERTGVQLIDRGVQRF